MDYGRLIRAGLLDWWKERSLQRWFIFLAVLYFVFSLGDIEMKQGGFESPLSQTMLWLLNAIVPSVLSAFVGRKVLTWRELPAKLINIREGFMFFLLIVYQAIVVLFLGMDFKWFAVPVVSLMLILVGLISSSLGSLLGLLLALLGFLGLLAYGVLLVYHALRLMFSRIFWLSEPISISSALKKSWEFTGERTGELFLGLLVPGGLMVVIVLFLSIGLVVLGLVALSPNATLYAVIAIGSTFFLLFYWAIITEAFIQFRQSSMHQPS